MKIPTFLPLLEASLFRELVDYTNKYGPAKIVDKGLIVSFDPLFPRIIRDIEGLEIRGETLFEHELAHFFAAQNEGFGDGYIAITFFWKQMINGQMVLSYEVMYSHRPASLTSQVRISLGPRYPGEGDFNILLGSFSQTFPNILEYISGRHEGKRLMSQKQKLWGRVVDADKMLDLLMYQWMEARKNDIDFFAPV